MQYTEKQLEAEIHTDRLTGTQHSLGEPPALQGCSWAFQTVTVLLASLQNIWLLDHTKHTQEKKFLCNISGVRYHLENVCCIPAGVRDHLCIIRSSWLCKNKQLNSLPGLRVAVKHILIEGLTQMYSTSCSPSHLSLVLNYLQLFGYPQVTAVVWFLFLKFLWQFSWFSTREVHLAPLQFLPQISWFLPLYWYNTVFVRVCLQGSFFKSYLGLLSTHSSVTFSVNFFIALFFSQMHSSGNFHSLAAFPFVP